MRVKSLTPPFPSVFPITPMTSSALNSPSVMPFSRPEASDTDFNSTLRTSIAIVLFAFQFTSNVAVAPDAAQFLDCGDLAEEAVDVAHCHLVLFVRIGCGAVAHKHNVVVVHEALAYGRLD